MVGRGRNRRHRAPQVQDVSHVLAAGLLDQMMGSPVTRLAETTASNRSYAAMDLDVQRFTVPSGGPNTPEALAASPISVNHARRLNKRRGEFPA